MTRRGDGGLSPQQKKWLRLLLLALVGVGVGARLYYALWFYGRVWVDEIWVVLSPAHKLLTGFGFFESDWEKWDMRSWLPPTLVFLWLKLLTVLGVTQGSVVLASVRVLISLATSVGFVFYIRLLQTELVVHTPLVLTAVVLFFTPEFIHYSTSADLSVLGLPLIMMGLYYFRCDRCIRGGMALLVLGSLIRFQYGLIPMTLVILLLQQRRYRHALELIGIALALIAVDSLYSSYFYGYFLIPVWRYFLLNTFGGVSASFGTTPFYAAFEILWRFMTEPVFVIAVFLLPFGLKRAPFVTAPLFVLALAHIAMPHKEFRFFYGPAVLFAGLATALLQKWIEEKRTLLKRMLAPLFVVVFVATALWRGELKVAWRQFEIPAKLEALAGEQPDVKGLITYGWGGIHSGGYYTFYRALPYLFTEKRRDLNRFNLDSKKYNYIVAPASETPPCMRCVKEEGGGKLYFCTESEMRVLLHST